MGPRHTAGRPGSRCRHERAGHARRRLGLVSTRRACQESARSRRHGDPGAHRDRRMAAPGLILSPSYQTITPRPAFGPTVVIPENSSPCNVAEPSPTKPAAPCADSVAANRKQAELFPSWRYHAFITDREGSAIFLDADHRNHAVVELNIRDLKEGAGMAHCPSGDFNANAAWTVLATVAHNMVRWIASLG